MKKLLIIFGLIGTAAFAAVGKLQNVDFATSAQITGAGGSVSQLLNSSKMYNSVDAEIMDTSIARWNAKQPAGSYITALTGDITATGPGSVAATIANLAVTNAKIANATIDLTAKVTGVLPLANGGTNNSAAASAGSVVYSDATKHAYTAVGTSGQVLTSAGTGAPTWTTPTTGTVTSVALSVPAASIFSVSGSPVTTSGTLALATAGTSGGIPYFSSTSALSSSALLAANQLVLGGGAGTAPATLGSLGTTTTLLHGNAAGAPTFGAVSLTADVSGTLPVANGGTGQTSYTDGQLLIGNTSGNTLTKSTLTAGTGITITNGNGSITIDSTGGTPTVGIVCSSHIVNTSGCTWNRTNSAYGSFSTTAACPGPTVDQTNSNSWGTCQTTDTDLPKNTVNSLVAGTYRVIYSIDVSSNSSRCAFRINDGTNSSGYIVTDYTSTFAGVAIGYFTYGSTANRTFELQSRDINGSTQCTVSDGGSGLDEFNFSIEKVQ